MSDSLTSYKSLDDWFRIVTECRQSGLTDDQWCQINGINKNTRSFFTSKEISIQK